MGGRGRKGIKRFSVAPGHRAEARVFCCGAACRSGIGVREWV